MKKNLNINSSPNLLHKETNESGVKKLNKGPLILIIAALIIVVVGLFYAALQRGVKNTTKETLNTQSTDNSDNVEKMLRELNIEKAKNIQKPIPKYNSKLASTHNLEQANQDILTVSKKLQEDEEKLRKLKMEQAIKAINGKSQLQLKTKRTDQNPKTLLATVANPSNNSETNTDDLIKTYLSGMGKNVVNKDKEAQSFLNKKSSYDYLNAKKTPLVSNYEIKTGTLIPSVLITGANSDLPGKMTAQVRENVYDTATGDFLLIPQGTKLIGEYSANILYGQSRLLVAWNRLIFPDGQTLNLGNMQGVAQDGYTGFNDQVDNHYVRIFGSALLMSAISAGVQLSMGDNEAGVESNADKAMSGAIQQLGQVGIEMIRKNMNISPTLNIRPGYRFNIFVTKDIILEPLEY
jgi:type IV secretion system protein TrbI